MATYKEIQKYVNSEYGFTVKRCWIAHVKEICGLPLRKAYNRIDSNKRKVPCPNNKVGPIQDAFKYFGII
jgi:hypothetical protein